MLSSTNSQKSRDIDGFWSHLRLFWQPEQVERWRRKIFPSSDSPSIGVDEVFNLICLAPHVHDMWNEGAFALRPLDGGNDYQLEVEFVWQTRYKLPSSSNVDLLKVPVSSQGLRRSPVPSDDADHRALDWKDWSPDLKAYPLYSGARFTITTTDPVNRPLPSKELLDMQWALQRLTAMAATAEWEWIEGSRDDNVSDGDNMNTMNTTFEDVFKWIPPPKDEKLMWRGPNERGLPSIACV